MLYEFIQLKFEYGRKKEVRIEVIFARERTLTIDWRELQGVFWSIGMFYVLFWVEFTWVCRYVQFIKPYT